MELPIFSFWHADIISYSLDAELFVIFKVKLGLSQLILD